MSVGVIGSREPLDIMIWIEGQPPTYLHLYPKTTADITFDQV